ncbi:probable receptor-like protein kinase At5g24010 [Cajanus cajan]|uniref:probable receptor-like protein kinase At5g24010 n=1 Tax=Cajanus cajan TaxID=3821 RepID=UPI00098DD064|nr:probable receptor-like protein kinase At5g24010 [Cajanus cajan]
MFIAEKLIPEHHFSMAILQLRIIQHSLCTVLVFLLQFPLLGYQYNVPDKYFINCGSDSSVTESGKAYVGETESNLKTNFNSSNTERSESPPLSPLYQTARIFRKDSWYEFNIDPTGTFLVRLHFYAFCSPSNLSSARFNVSVPAFWLLRNFNATNGTNNNSALVKEFFIHITSPSFRITFRPLPSSFAFVNAIELFLLPLHLIDDRVSRFTYSGNNQGLDAYNNLYSRVLETKHRLNVGGQTTKDSLLRKWIPDDTYLVYPENAKNSSPYHDIKYRVSDDSGGPNANNFTAPIDVYGTAKEINNNSAGAGDAKLLNITWRLPVEKNIDHLLRLHFCDYFSSQIDLAFFNVSIYDINVMPVNNDKNVSNELPAPYYYDFVVHSDDSGFMRRVSVTPDASAYVPNAFLNGIEIMKMIELPNSVSIPSDMGKSDSKHNHLPVLLGSVLGGLVLFFVVVVVLVFLWRLKMRKQKPVENLDWLPMPVIAGGSSHGRLTEGTVQGPPLPNINLGLKIPLLDLQLATKNFHTSQIIGKGGFGNVYNGVLKNGMIVAVKRSQPGSGQGLPEFQTEIMVLSKIRHKHLVSLIGYCDESFEMILVYEYMEKGTLRDHLYNTNFPSLSWEQRLDICIGAAKGLHYLHKGVVGGIIHRDVKSTNILLDENHVAKVSDFGLSRTGPLDHESHVSTSVKGTLGYLDPEYLRKQQLTEKSDVYSFGVVLLEVLCSRPVIDSSLPSEQINLGEWGMLCQNKGILQGIVDPSIKDQIDENSLRKFSETVEKCLQEVGSDRPTMGDVLWDLEYALQLQRGVHGNSYSSVSASLQLPNVRRLASFSTPNEVDDLSKILNSGSIM